MGNKSSTRKQRSSTKLNKVGSGKASKHRKRSQKSVSFKNRLQDVLQKWQDYKDLLDNDMQFLTGEFTQWMADCDRDVPDNLPEAQRKLENIKAMWERMSGMRQELTNAAHRCENLGGSMENLSEEEAQQESNVNQQAEKVEDKFKEANAELEKRMDSVRDTIHQWELVDRMRGDLRNWLHSKQEEFQEMEEKPAKLHAEAAEIEIANLQALREEVQAKGPAIDSFLNKYRDLTQHNPSLVDPVMRAVREDWEELLGQIENLLEDRENNLQASRELQEAQNTMDDDLENYVKELERIEKEDVAVQEKSLQLKTELFRKPCRSTQTPNSSAKFGSRRNLLGFGSDDSGDDDDGDDSVFKWPSSRHGPSRSHSRQSLNHSRQSLNHSRQSLNQSRQSQKRGPSSSHHRTFSPNPRSRSRNSRHNQSNDDLKKGAAAALESESEESGYGETYYTMHASSFDNVLENETIDTMRGTPLGLDMTRYSDNDSTVSYITGEFPQANPEDLRNTMTQTPGHARTQTEPDMNDSPRTIHTQTSGLARNMSMQTSRMSIASGRSTGSRGSRADLLRSILMDVKEIKQQRGLNDSPGLSEDSMISNTSVKKNMLQTIQSDVQALKNEGRQGTAGTQTISEQGTQTGIKLFPEGDSVRNSRHGRLRDLMDDVKNLKGGSPDSPNDLRSRQSSRTGTPYERRPLSSVQNRPSPVRFSTPGPATNGPVQNGVPEQNGYDYPQQPYMRSLPVPPNPQPQMNGYPQYPGRMVTQDDINAISDRIQRLQNYQLPPRRTLPQPPPQPPQYIVPVYTAPPRRVRINEFPQTYNDEDGFMSDESEYEGGHAPRRGRRRRNRLDHLDIEDALDEAVKQGHQLKNMSKKMKDSLREDLLDL
ncbi:SYNE1 [Mytilus coruscus]|uniref:SYNE1 n=1 Tax=Mytilus coruscus TaxID=42192 RepID=A0A6J8C2X7_MYTCO|nr:SYNE1 [Mytilus coruscus]